MIGVTVASAYWRVIALCDESESCQVIDYLDELAVGNKTEKSLAVRMKALLEQKVPSQAASPPITNIEISRPLGDGLFEFKQGTSRGPKLRVLYFYGQNREIICTNAFLKDTKRTPPEELETAQSFRRAYEAACQANKLAMIKQETYKQHRDSK